MSFDWIPLDWVTATIALVIIVYFYLTWNHDYWKKRKISFVKPKLFFGSYKDVFFAKKTVGEVMEEIYNTVDNKPFVGFWRFREPGLLVRDLEVAKTVLIKEFNSFQENGFLIDAHMDPLISKNPFFLSGDRWKTTRSLLTPSFTAGKLKPLLPLMEEVCAEFVEYLRESASTVGTDGYQTKELSSKYTTEMVATCAFGIKGNTFKDPNAEIRSHARRVFEPGFWKNAEFLITTIMPNLGRLLKVRIMPKDVDKFFRGIVSDVIGHRQKNGITRNDFLQNLIHLKNSGDYTDEDVTAHCVTFLTEGVETSAIVLGFMLYELARHPEEQEALRREVRAARAAADGKISFETLHELPLLDQVLQETMRLHVPLMQMEKIVSRDVRLRADDGSEVALERGTLVVIPVRALHRDPRLHPDPLRFDPGRFSAERRERMHKCAFLPFGEGPRMCLGMRFAHSQIKLGIVSLLEHFEIKTTPRTPERVEQDPTFFLSHAKGGLWVRFEPLKSAA